jgi:glycosyltransferase involved in cell wall biosynthesis
MSHITIITTTYKHQEFVARTIDSVISQTRTDWTLLIGDDSPDDATREIIQSYVSKYPEKIKARHHTPNKGIVDNMLFLIDHIPSHTTHIAFLEGDDMMTSDNLSKKMNIFAQYPGLGMVYSDMSFIDAGDHVILPSLNTFRKIPVYIDKTLSIDEIIRHTL